MRKLIRDKIISVVKGKDLVGVYWEGTDGKEILFECSPQKADKIVKIFNSRDSKEVDKFMLYEYACDDCHSVWYVPVEEKRELDIEFGCPHGCDNAGRYCGKMVVLNYKLIMSKELKDEKEKNF